MNGSAAPNNFVEETQRRWELIESGYRPTEILPDASAQEILDQLQARTRETRAHATKVLQRAGGGAEVWEQREKPLRGRFASSGPCPLLSLDEVYRDASLCTVKASPSKNEQIWQSKGYVLAGRIPIEHARGKVGAYVTHLAKYIGKNVKVHRNFLSNTIAIWVKRGPTANNRGDLLYLPDAETLSQDEFQLFFQKGERGPECRSSWLFVPDSNPRGITIRSDGMYRCKGVGQSKGTVFVRAVEDLGALCNHRTQWLQQKIRKGEYTGVMEGTIRYQAACHKGGYNSDVSVDENGDLQSRKWSVTLSCDNPKQELWHERVYENVQSYRGTHTTKIEFDEHIPVRDVDPETIYEVGTRVLRQWIHSEATTQRYAQQAQRIRELAGCFGGKEEMQRRLRELAPKSPITFDALVDTTMKEIEQSPESTLRRSVATNFGEKRLRWLGLRSAYADVPSVEFETIVLTTDYPNIEHLSVSAAVIVGSDGDGPSAVRIERPLTNEVPKPDVPVEDAEDARALVEQREADLQFLVKESPAIGIVQQIYREPGRMQHETVRRSVAVPLREDGSVLVEPPAKTMGVLLDFKSIETASASDLIELRQCKRLFRGATEIDRDVLNGDALIPREIVYEKAGDQIVDELATHLQQFPESPYAGQYNRVTQQWRENKEPARQLRAAQRLLGLFKKWQDVYAEAEAIEETVLDLDSNIKRLMPYDVRVWEGIIRCNNGAMRGDELRTKAPKNVESARSVLATEESDDDWQTWLRQAKEMQRIQKDLHRGQEIQQLFEDNKDRCFQTLEAERNGIVVACVETARRSDPLTLAVDHYGNTILADNDPSNPSGSMTEREKRALERRGKNPPGNGKWDELGLRWTSLPSDAIVLENGAVKHLPEQLSEQQINALDHVLASIGKSAAAVGLTTEQLRRQQALIESLEYSRVLKDYFPAGEEVLFGEDGYMHPIQYIQRQLDIHNGTAFHTEICSKEGKMVMHSRDLYCFDRVRTFHRNCPASDLSEEAYIVERLAVDGGVAEILRVFNSLGGKFDLRIRWRELQHEETPPERYESSGTGRRSAKLDGPVQSTSVRAGQSSEIVGSERRQATPESLPTPVATFELPQLPPLDTMDEVAILEEQENNASTIDSIISSHPEIEALLQEHHTAQSQCSSLQAEIARRQRENDKTKYPPGSRKSDLNVQIVKYIAQIRDIERQLQPLDALRQRLEQLRKRQRDIENL
jgi:hypothetical protein